MGEMFAWYIDNRYFITKDFVDTLISNKEEAINSGKPLRNIIRKHMDDPNKGNPSSPITFAKNVGLLGNDDEYGIPLMLYKEGVYPFSCLLLDLISKRNVSKTQEIPMKPLVSLCKVFTIMHEEIVPLEERFITTAEVFEYLSVLDSYAELTRDLVNKIVSDRVYSTAVHYPDKRIEVKNEVYISSIFSALNETPLFRTGIRKGVLHYEEKYIEVIKHIATAGESMSNAPTATGSNNKAFYDYCTDVNTGILEIISPLPLKAGVEMPAEYTREIFEYLFGVNVTKVFEWESYFTEDCHGIYRMYYPIRWLPLLKVYIQNASLGEHLLDYTMQADGYIDSWKEGKLMIEIPFSNSKHTDISELTRGDKIDNERAFKKWFARQLKENGLPYSDNTRNQYISALKAIPTVFMDAIAPLTSIFEIDDQDVFERVSTAVKETDAFEEFNKSRGNGSLSAALDMYGRFLVERDEDMEDMFTPEWFREKAAEYPTLDEEANQLLADFQQKFNPDYLASLSGIDMLNTIFLNAVETDNVCRVLEFGAKIKDTFGSIKGGNAYKYGLYYSAQGHWMTGSHQKPRQLTEDEAIAVGAKLRDHLVAGAEAIKNYGPLTTIEDYKKLHKILTEATEGDIERVWFLKYYQMLYPELFATNYSDYAQRTVLNAIGEEKEKYALVRMGQIRFYANKCGISNVMFNKIFWEYYSEEAVAAQKNEPSQDVCFTTGYHSIFARNRILFGAPGTGKSFTLNKEKDSLLADGGEYERVTFHPDYSYANFVGTYKPVPCKDNNENDAITYSYVPGPFMRMYVKALLNSRTDAPKPFLLIIEEINRANVAAVFGDVFQLLDRGDDEVSEYAIQASEDIKNYLARELGGVPNDYAEIRIPDNMFIWATMNSADQGVFPMDTAFKRRWDFTYLGIDDSEAGIKGKTVILGKGEHRKVVEWNELRKAINEELLTYKVNEDKLMGPYFISKKILPEGDIIDPVTFTRVFKNKVIMYLFDDAAKQKRITLFGGCAEKDKNQYSKVCAAFDTLGVDIFWDSISSRFIDKAPEGDAE